MVVSGAALAEDAQRWRDLQQAIFGNRIVQDGSNMLALDAPSRADDAALVPISISLRTGLKLKGLYVVIDDNPAPLAAHISFGPAAYPGALQMRVRVDQYTLIHAVAEAADGKLYSVQAFVKAAGGCSAPSDSSSDAATAHIGQMKLHMLTGFVAGKPMTVQLLIRHPNFNGMQMNQVTRFYTPPRFINAVDISYEGVAVMHIDSDISISSDPAFTFDFLPLGKGILRFLAKDSSGVSFNHDFLIPDSQS